MIRLRALTLSNKIKDFSLNDCPVYVSQSTIALMSDRMSTLIKAETILRGDDETGIYEGDMVYENGEYVGNVIYNAGFKVQKTDGTQKSLSLGSHIKIETGTIESIKTVCSSSKRTFLLFKCREYIIQLNLFLCKLNDNQIAVLGNSYDGKFLDCEDVQFYTGVKRGNVAVFFGDEIDGGKVILHNLQPCIQYGDTYRRLSDE